MCSSKSRTSRRTPCAGAPSLGHRHGRQASATSAAWILRFRSARSERATALMLADCGRQAWPSAGDAGAGALAEALAREPAPQPARSDCSAHRSNPRSVAATLTGLGMQVENHSHGLGGHASEPSLRHHHRSGSHRGSGAHRRLRRHRRDRCADGAAVRARCPKSSRPIARCSRRSPRAAITKPSPTRSSTRRASSACFRSARASRWRMPSPRISR